MSIAPFETIGDVSRKSMVVQTLSSANYNDLVPYKLLEELLEVDRNVVQSVVNQAKLALEQDHLKSVVAERGMGYRVVHPGEQRGLAVAHQQKARRSLRRSLSKVTNVDVAQLSDGEKTAVTLAATAIGLQLDYARRNDIRAKRHEQMIEATQQQSARTGQEVSDLKDRLARLEESMKGTQ